MKVRPKKSLGQHFLTDASIAKRIAESIKPPLNGMLLEIGPGTGALTKHLANVHQNYKTIEIDNESADYLQASYPQLEIIREDFLRFDLAQLGDVPINIIGNFPYNISSQILFAILESGCHVPQVVCMLQREVARRIASARAIKNTAY